jgi:ABC-2 type transport system permease protein
MKSLIAFIKKEWMEQVRSGRLLILLILFTLFGIMNPAIAKLTPWMLETLSDSLAENGMTVTTVTVDALTSWTQFFKNVPIALIAFVLLESAIFTKEYQAGTLVLTLTKGLSRYKVVVAKAAVLLFLWSAGYWLCFGITYGYNAYFWDNEIAENLMLSVLSWWLFGVWTVILTVLFSAIARSNSTVLLGTGGTCLAAYLLGLLPKLQEYVPTMLMNGTLLIYGTYAAEDYNIAIIITIVLCIICFGASIPLFNKKQL